MFSQIHEIVFHGNGYDYETVYNMPIWLRNFTYAKLEDYFEKQKEQQELMKPKTQSTDKKLHRPDIKPTYTTKASK
jgi:hypothetical protein